MSRVPGEETAFGDRSSPILLGVEANRGEPQDDEANVPSGLDLRRSERSSGSRAPTVRKDLRTRRFGRQLEHERRLNRWR